MSIPEPIDVTSTMPQEGRTSSAGSDHRREMGLALVALAALIWSSGGLIVRSLESADTWTAVFWRSATAALFLLCFLLWREGRKAPRLVLGMGWPGLLVALCYASASMALVVALGLTSVAHVLVIMSCAPLLAALLGLLVLGERVGVIGWFAMAASIVGIGLMVSESTGRSDLIGDAVAFSITLAQAIAVVTMRRHRTISMIPAMLAATVIAMLVALPLAKPLSVTLHDLVLLTIFGAGQLGLGLALFAIGAPLVPAAQAALLNSLEPILGPLWVWLALGERPSGMALVGGAVVLAALTVYTLLGLRRDSRSGSG